MTDRALTGDDADPVVGDVGIQGHPIDPVLGQLKSLREAFDAKIRYDEARERFVASMSEELAEHRQDLYQKLLRPVLLDLVGMYDDLTKVLESADETAMPTAQLEYFRDIVEQILARNGAERFIVDGNAIDRANQRVVRVTETQDPGLDRRLERRLRPGFSWNGKVLRPEWVSAYRYDASPPEDPPAWPPEATDHLPTDAARFAQLADQGEEGAPS